jgi:hypothetical protein
MEQHAALNRSQYAKYLRVNTHCWHLQVSIWTVRMSLTSSQVSPFTNPQLHLESKENVANFNSHEVRAVLPSTNPKLSAGVKAFPPYVFLSLVSSPYLPSFPSYTRTSVSCVVPEVRWPYTVLCDRNTEQLKLLVCHLVILPRKWLTVES